MKSDWEQQDAEAIATQGMVIVHLWIANAPDEERVHIMCCDERPVWISPGERITTDMTKVTCSACMAGGGNKIN